MNASARKSHCFTYQHIFCLSLTIKVEKKFSLNLSLKWSLALNWPLFWLAGGSELTENGWTAAYMFSELKKGNVSLSCRHTSNWHKSKSSISGVLVNSESAEPSFQVVNIFFSSFKVSGFFLIIAVTFELEKHPKKYKNETRQESFIFPSVVPGWELIHM